MDKGCNQDNKGLDCEFWAVLKDFLFLYHFTKKKFNSKKLVSPFY